MKFRLVFDGAEKRIELTPENPGEQTLLGSIIDPNNTTGEGLVKEASVSVEASHDRPPYRKVMMLKVVM